MRMTCEAALKLLFDVIHRASRQDLVLARESTSSQEALVHFQRLLQDVEAGRGGCNVQTAGLWVACAEIYVLERELEHATTTIAIAKRLSPFLPDVAFLQVGWEEGVQQQLTWLLSGAHREGAGETRCSA